MNLYQVLFALVRNQISGEAISEETKEFAKDHVKQLYMLASPNGLSLLLGQALSDLKLLGDDPVSQKIQARNMKLFGLQMQQEMAYAQICQCLETYEIPFVPLKGSVIRKYYPQSWMRTSCDIDILVREEDVSKAVSVLKTELQYTQPADREYHDVALYSPQGVLLELHFSLKENHEKLDLVLAQAWEHVAPVAEHTYQKAFARPFFVHHILAHCAYHFMSSGCGARPLLDLWLLKHRMGYEEEKVLELCRISGLETFYTQIMALADVWFAGAESSPELDRLASYILHAGFGGSKENAAAAAVLKTGGKSNYFAGRLFLPYDMLKEYYPELNDHKWLMPICQVRRWCAGLKRRKLRDMVTEVKVGANVDQAKLSETEALFEKLKLN